MLFFPYILYTCILFIYLLKDKYLTVCPEVHVYQAIFIIDTKIVSIITKDLCLVHIIFIKHWEICHVINDP